MLKSGMYEVIKGSGFVSCLQNQTNEIVSSVNIWLQVALNNWWIIII